MATTGDLTRKIALSPTARWEDEDARLLANTFNTMTDSIARFQREAAQRERLSSLERLSTVVAHEIRNTLMIIRTALRTLKHATGHPPEVQSAVADIDEEVTRLNRIVAEVLDFARPIKFDRAPVNVNALCEDAVRAVGGEEPGVAAPDLTCARVNRDRWGTRAAALINILTNARHAAGASRSSGARRPGDPAHHAETAWAVGIDVRDQESGLRPMIWRGSSIRSSRRGRAGLGLAISRRIIEGLGVPFRSPAVRATARAFDRAPLASWEPNNLERRTL
jgi:two-component system sensor histidine kinase HydH